MIRMLCTIFLTICCISPVHAITPWEEYLDLPNATNAKRVTDITYSTANGGVSHDYDARDLDILSLQINSGDVAAIQLAFRLRKNSDGGLLEELDAMLGHIVRAHPMLFLEQLALAKVPVIVIESIVMDSGLEYTDRRAAQRYEIEMRHKSILAVHSEDAEIVRVRNECLRILKRATK